MDSEKNNIADKLPQLWGAFVPRMEEIPNRIANVSYGIIQQEKGNTDLLEYYAVVEVTSMDQLPAGMISLEIPQSTYAKFVHKGKVTNINNTVNYIYSSWLLQSGRRHSYAADNKDPRGKPSCFASLHCVKRGISSYFECNKFTPQGRGIYPC